MRPKDLLKTLLRNAGIEVRRRRLGRQIDAFADQQALLKGREVKVIFDVGGNVGQTALRYRALYPRATVHSFEPFPQAFEALRTIARADSSIVPHQVAIADAPGQKDFFVSTDDQWGSLSPVAGDVSDTLNIGWKIGPKSTLTVPSTTLDAFAAEHPIESVSILKMDIQGGELLALKGADRLLASSSIDLIYSEVLFKRLYEKQCFFHELDAYLMVHGYQLFGLYNVYCGKHVAMVTGDAIWMSPRLWQSPG